MSSRVPPLRHPHHPPVPGSGRAARRLPIGLLVAAMLVGACGSSPSPSGSQGALTPTPTATPAPASPSPSAVASLVPTPSPTPTLPSGVGDLTGLAVDPAVAHRLPIAVMIDDNRVARPQSGFNAASIVYQAPADGYETRYMLVFQEGDTKQVGPVRSARFYLAQWASELRAIISHYGGDRRTRRHIRYNPQMFTDVDGLGRGNSAYHRVKSRKAPHNAYASTASLRRVGQKLGASATLPTTIHRRPFVDPAPLAERGASQRIRIPYRTNVITYRYDPATDRYARSIDGRAQIDPADRQRVAPTNVVVLFQKFRIDTKIERGHSRPDITTLGKGRALVFREGHVVKAFWTKDRDTSPTLVVDAEGHEIPLVRGQTFIQSVPPGTKVSYTD